MGDFFDPSGISVWLVAGPGSVTCNGGEVCATAVHCFILVCATYFYIYFHCRQ